MQVRGRGHGVPKAAGATAVALGLVVLLGWSLDAPALKSVVAGRATMKANTALSFVLLGTAVLLARRGRTTVATIPALATMTISVTTLLEYAGGLDLGIDQLLFRDVTGTGIPGRMSVITAISFALFASAVLVAHRRPATSQGIVLVGMFGPSLAAIGHLFAVPDFTTILTGATSVAVHTALGFLILGAGVAWLHPNAGIVGVITEPDHVGRLSRRLLPAVLLSILGFAWLGLRGQQTGLYSPGFGMALMTALNILLIVLMFSIANHRLRLVQREASRTAESLERFFTISFEMLAVVDVEGRFLQLNPAWEETLGWRREEMLGRPYVDFVHPDDRAQTEEEAARIIATGASTARFQNRYQTKDGSHRWLAWTSAIDTEHGLFYAAARDITADKEREETSARYREELRLLTLIDPLTGLYNRRGLLTLGEQQLRLAHREDRRAVLLFVDLDDMKQINDSRGHAEGDRALVATAGVLRETFRDSDVIARVGGDEFCVLALARDAEAADRARARLEEVLARRNATAADRPSLSLSVGFASCGPGEAIAIEDLMERADAAMYREKPTGPTKRHGDG